MSLDAAKAVQHSPAAIDAAHNVIKGDFPLHSFSRWEAWPASDISHHGEMCCEIGREWLVAMDRTELGASDPMTGPRWLTQRFKWGASTFPIYWCEAVIRKQLDCGALAALSNEVFTSRGVRAFRAQMVLQYSEVATSQWQASWTSDDTPLPWTDGELIYHEGSAILVDDSRVKVWDSSAGWWIDPRVGNGYGSLLSLRLSLREPSIAGDVKWGSLNVPINRWYELDSQIPAARSAAST